MTMTMTSATMMTANMTNATSTTLTRRRRNLQGLGKRKQLEGRSKRHVIKRLEGVTCWVKNEKFVLLTERGVLSKSWVTLFQIAG
jgi:hypothetical protein